ncbi:hypothetical protein U1Q18_011934 [Sarracenia purpurea var. burkii]
MHANLMDCQGLTKDVEPVRLLVEPATNVDLAAADAEAADGSPTYGVYPLLAGASTVNGKTYISNQEE